MAIPNGPGMPNPSGYIRAVRLGDASASTFGPGTTSLKSLTGALKPPWHVEPAPKPRHAESAPPGIRRRAVERQKQAEKIAKAVAAQNAAKKAAQKAASTPAQAQKANTFSRTFGRMSTSQKGFDHHC